MAVAASPYHPLAKDSEVRPEDLDGLDFIAFDEDLPIRKDIDRFLREHHVHVNVTLHFDNIQMIKEAVAHGSGISIMPARVMEEEVGQGRLVPIRIAGFRAVSVRSASCTARKSAFSAPDRPCWNSCRPRPASHRRCNRASCLESSQSGAVPQGFSRSRGRRPRRPLFVRSQSRTRGPARTRASHAGLSHESWAGD